MVKPRSDDIGVGAPQVGDIGRITNFSFARTAISGRWAAPLDQGVFVGRDDGVRATAHPELGEEPVDVRLDGRLADVQLGSDVAVGPSSADKLEDLDLAFGQRSQRLRVVAGTGRRNQSSTSRRVISGASRGWPLVDEAHGTHELEAARLTEWLGGVGVLPRFPSPPSKTAATNR
jgi:hypothetical protein